MVFYICIFSITPSKLTDLSFSFPLYCSYSLPSASGAKARAGGKETGNSSVDTEMEMSWWCSLDLAGAQSWLTYVTLLIYFEESLICSTPDRNKYTSTSPSLRFHVVSVFFWLKPLCLSRLAFGQDLRPIEVVSPAEVLSHYWPTSGSLLHWQYLGRTRYMQLNNLSFTMTSKQLDGNLLLLDLSSVSQISVIAFLKM